MDVVEAVSDGLIDRVVDTTTGETHFARSLIERERRLVIEWRAEIKDRLHTQPLLKCLYCLVPVYLVSSERGQFFFRHLIEDGSCRYTTRGQRDQSTILALQFRGQKEGPRHRELKGYIEQSLRADARFEKIRSERRVSGNLTDKEWRQPDVQAHFNGLGIAFDIQLSYTFLDVMRERRAFYLRNRWFLFWIFGGFDPEHPRLFQEDVCYTNNSNLFVVNNETVAVSQRDSRFSLECWYCEPQLSGGLAVDHWKSAIVSIDSLTIDQATQRVYFYDYADARKKLARHDENDEDYRLRARFEQFWVTRFTFTASEAAEQEYRALRKEFQKKMITLPARHSTSPFAGVMRILYSAKLGRPVGFSYRNLIQVAHHAYDRHQGFLRPFGWLIKHHHQEAILEQQDRSGKWANRRAKLREAMTQGEAAFLHDSSYDEVLSFCFPEISKQLLALSLRGSQSEKNGGHHDAT